MRNVHRIIDPEPQRERASFASLLYQTLSTFFYTVGNINKKKVVTARMRSTSHRRGVRLCYDQESPIGLGMGMPPCSTIIPLNGLTSSISLACLSAPKHRQGGMASS